MARRRRAGQKGFTLYETLIALAILAVAGISATQVMQTGLARSAKARSLIEAAQEMETVLSEIGATLPFAPGRYDTDLPSGRTARLTITPRPDLPQALYRDKAKRTGRAARVYQVDVAVHSGDGAVLARVTTFRLGAR